MIGSKHVSWIRLGVYFLLGALLASCGAGVSQPLTSEADMSPAEQEGEVREAEPEAQEGELDEPTQEQEAEPISFNLWTAMFSEGEPIPTQFSCDGEDISPPLEWWGTPAGTVSHVLIMDDPDAPVGTWNHWVLFNIPGDSAGLPEGVPPEDMLADGSTHGANSWGRNDYGGPCPPSGTHRYFFRLFALDTSLALPAGAELDLVLANMEGHVLAETSLMGIYTR